MARNWRKKGARMQEHNAVMTAWHRYLATLGDTRPLEGEGRYVLMFVAFTAGWEARGKRHAVR